MFLRKRVDARMVSAAPSQISEPPPPSPSDDALTAAGRWIPTRLQRVCQQVAACLLSEGFFSKPSLKSRNTIFTLGQRGAILSPAELEGPILVPHTAQRGDSRVGLACAAPEPGAPGCSPHQQLAHIDAILCSCPCSIRTRRCSAVSTTLCWTTAAESSSSCPTSSWWWETRPSTSSTASWGKRSACFWYEEGFASHVRSLHTHTNTH